SNIDIAKLVNYDIFAVDKDEHRGVVVKMFVRDGKVVSSTHSFFKHTQNFDQDAVYRQALIEYYSLDIPVLNSEILVADAIDFEGLDDFFASKFDKKMQLLHPQRGAKKSLIEVAKKNAAQMLKTPSSENYEINKTLKELLDLDTTPYRIECFDNSHMAGSATVGTMIVYDEGKFDKSSYKRYHLHAKDEYGQMQELLERRISSFDKESPPDLWLLDGGDTLVKLAQKLLRKVGVNLDVVGIAKQKVDAKAKRAKGSAKDIIYKADEALRLQPSDTRLHLLQKLRDEAHRFAITFHKQTKLKTDKKMSLLEISGIGPAKAKKLIHYFGSFEKIQNASAKDLEAILSASDAQKVHNFYKKSTK
ncbi:MAG: helix-hairpin-helix domain-containing protein, partial [Campylobacterota bacterium]